MAGAAHLNFFEAMRAEHCSRAGSDKEFETLNYRIKRRARAECAPVRPALLSALRVALVGRRALHYCPAIVLARPPLSRCTVCSAYKRRGGDARSLRAPFETLHAR